MIIDPTNKRRNLFELSVLCILFLFAHLITSCNTSPLYPYCHGGDSALFFLLGKGITEGKLLYVDLFDHKGPFIFFLNALGYLLGNRTGIFLLQGVFGLISLVFLYKTTELFYTKKESSPMWICWFLFACGYIVCFRTFECGNLTEEYSQPFISCTLYLFTRYAIHAESQPMHSLIYAFIYGICMAILALLRLNNAVTVCAGVLAIFVYLIYKKKYKNLVVNLIFGILGICVVFVPVCAYFLYHSALDEMVFAAFLYNFRIFGGDSHYSLFSDPVNYIALYLPIVISALLVIVKVRNTKQFAFIDFLLVFILAANAANLWFANRYPHYFALFAPVYIVYLCRYLVVDFKKAAVYFVILCTVCNLGYLANNAGRGIYSSYISFSAKYRSEAIQEAVMQIPEDERNRVIGYEIPVSYYVSGNIMPCYKYYTWQENWGSVNPDVLIDFMEWVKTDQPLWILTLPDEDNPEVLAILSEHYQLHYVNDLLAIYQLQKG